MGKTRAENVRNREKAEKMLISGKTIQETARELNLKENTVWKYKTELEISGKIPQRVKTEDILKQWDEFVSRLKRPICVRERGAGK